MKKLFYSFIEPSLRKRSILILSLSVLLFVLAGVVTISENPPGLMLALLSSIAFVFSFVHQWTKPKKYIFLLIAAIILFVLSVVLHNVFEAFGMLSATHFYFSSAMNVIGTFFFLVALFLCPAGFITGFLGAVFWFAKNKTTKSTA